MIPLADLHDAHPGKLSVADPIFTNYGGNSAFHGAVFTLKVDDDFLLIKQTLQLPGEHRVLVIDGGGSMRCALLGDKLATMAAQNNWAGIVVNGCIRDSAAIAETPIGVKALNTCPIKPAMSGNGESDLTLQFAGLRVQPGDFLYADSDGIAIASELLHL